MSRVGKKPIPLPQGVKVTTAASTATVEGPKGKLAQALPAGITCTVEDGQLNVARSDDSRQQRALHGLMRSLLANAVHGTAKGFTRELQIEGIGYRAQLQGKDLNLTLGYSHPVKYPVPDGIEIKLDGQTKIAVSGIDRQRVGQVSAEIRALRPPEPYKGKGIRYAGEHVRRKVGKTGA